MKTQPITATDFWKEKFDEYPQSDADKLAVAMMQEYHNAMKLSSTPPRDSQGFIIGVDIDEPIEPGPPTLEQFKKDCEEWIPNDFARMMFVDRYKGLFAHPPSSNGSTRRQP